MIKRNIYLILMLIIGFFNACQITHNEGRTNKNKVVGRDKRLVTIGGTVTEIVDGLGFGDQIVASDKTSTYPLYIKDLPSLGYRNSIRAEGILAMEPDLVLVQKDCIDAAVCNQLKESGIDLQVFENEHSIINTKKIINQLGIALNAKDRAVELVNSIDKDLLKLDKLISEEPNSRPKVLFIYARGSSTQNIAGRGTFAESIIELAGGQLAVPEINGFKPLTTEALIKANPDYLLFFKSGFESIGGAEGVMSIPGIDQTNAGKKRAFIAMDGLLLSGFGSRVGKAIVQLNKSIYPALTSYYESGN